MHTRPHVVGATAAALAVLFALPGPSSAQDRLVDRVLATVNGRVITLSDVQGVRALGLIQPPPGSDPAKAVLDRIIDRVLVLEEVERYAPPEPDRAAIEQAVAAVRAAHGPGYESALAVSGRDETFLRRWVRNSLRIDSYIAQRFAGVAEPNDDDLERYRGEHPPRSGATPMDDEAIANAVTSERRATLVREWIDGLRARAAVTINPPA